ncbi:hypothetical protein PAMH19_0265 [Pseudomonas aeruginosa]|nr:hypothetical protein PAMH19_0265 [Pseudomonas aeruginosa]
MATPAYMSITGTKQGLITAGAFTEDSVGNTYQEGHEDQVMVQGFNHEVIIPRDPQSGQPTGQRVHKPAPAAGRPDLRRAPDQGRDPVVPHLRRRHPGALLHHRPGRRDHRRHQGLHA